MTEKPYEKSELRKISLNVIDSPNMNIPYKNFPFVIQNVSHSVIFVVVVVA